MDHLNFEQNPLVYLREIKVIGVVIQETPTMSYVRYHKDGGLHEEWFDDADFVEVDRILIQYIDEDE